MKPIPPFLISQPMTLNFDAWRVKHISPGWHHMERLGSVSIHTLRRAELDGVCNLALAIFYTAAKAAGACELP